MKLFLTGGTGLIGTHFIQQALQAQHTLVVQRRPNSKPRLHLPDITPERLQWVDRPLDGIFEKELASCEAVVHLAAHTPNTPYAPWDECMYWNVYATSRLLMQASKVGIKRILVAGTCFEYGAAAHGQDTIHPATSLQPSLSYPSSKAAASTMCIAMAQALGWQLDILRMFQVYGEGEAAHRFWPSLRAAAQAGCDFPMSTGEQVRDFIAVETVAGRFLQVLSETPPREGEACVRNVGLGQGQSLRSFAEHWWQTWGAKGQLLLGAIPQRAGEIPRLVADITHVYRVS